jgi:hypothetical protein
MDKDTVELAAQMVFEHVAYDADLATVAADTIDSFNAVGEPAWCTYDELCDAMRAVNELRLTGKSYQNCVDILSKLS